VSHGDLQLLGGVGAGKPFDHRELKGSPRPRFDSLLDPMHRQLDELRVEGVLEVPFQVRLGLGRFGERVDRTGVVAGVLAPGAHEVAPGVLSDGLEPGTEAARRIVLELAKRGEQLDQDLLSDVGGVGVLHTPVQAPSADPRLVPLDEQAPGLRVVRVVLEPLQQGHRGVGVTAGRHRRALPRCQDGTAQFSTMPNGGKPSGQRVGWAWVVERWC